MARFMVSLLIKHEIPTAINIVIAFSMGTDIENIMASPIGQPMATVSRLFFAPAFDAADTDSIELLDW